MCVRFCVCVPETRGQAEGARGGTENGFSKGWRFGGVKGRAGQGCVRSAAETVADAQNRAYLRSYCGYLWRYSGYLRIPVRLFIELRGRRVRGAQRPGPNSPKLSCARLARCIAAQRARTCTTPCVRARASLCAWLRVAASVSHISARARACVHDCIHFIHAPPVQARARASPSPSRRAHRPRLRRRSAAWVRRSSTGRSRSRTPSTPPPVRFRVRASAGAGVSERVCLRV